jgi:hypothetical protein
VLTQSLETDRLYHPILFASALILLCFVVVGLFAGFVRFSAPHVLP